MATSNNRKWLLLPPAAALLIVLGPLSMPGAKKAPAAEPAPAATAQAPAAAATDRPAALPVPRTPDLWQVGSTSVGLVLLGGAALMAITRRQKGPGGTHQDTVQLRQTLRLGQHKAVHAIEFDGRVLLVGASERGLQLLHAGGPSQDALADEATIAARSGQAAVDEDDDGAVPKDLVIPRPTQPARRLPSPPVAPAAAPKRNELLNDFRALLQKAGR